VCVGNLAKGTRHKFVEGARVCLSTLSFTPAGSVHLRPTTAQLDCGALVDTVQCSGKSEINFLDAVILSCNRERVSLN
jgi:hypothetical protein